MATLQNDLRFARIRFNFQRGLIYTLCLADSSGKEAMASRALNGSSNPSLRELRSAFLAVPGAVENLVIKSKDGDTHNIDLALADYV